MKYSIITCVFNAQRYLYDYFYHISKIHYHDFEIIIIDDCSTDNTKSIVLERIRESDNITYIRLDKNLGPGNARNEGIAHASGEYILFVDVDDYIDSNIFFALDKYKTTDIILFDYITFNSKKIIAKKSTITDSKIEANSIYEMMKMISGCVWGKRFKKALIDRYNIRFPSLYKSEDLVFLMRYLMKCKSFEYCKKNLYYYRISENSLMHRNIRNQITYAKKAMCLLKNEPGFSKEVYNVLYFKEIVYDLTNIFIKIGYGKKQMMSVWKSADLDWSILKQKKYFTKYQYLGLSLIKKRRFYFLKLFNCLK